VYLVVPSWVIPGSYLENLKFLEDQPAINGVELLFFMYDRDVKTLLDTEWTGIREYERRFTLTAHLPDNLQPEHEELVARLLPFAKHLIVHPGSPDQGKTQGRLLATWAGKYAQSSSTEQPQGKGREPGRFLVENTRSAWFEALLPYLPDETGLCMDTGHLLLEGKSPAAFFTHYGNRIREIHLHGIDREQAVKDGRLPDHRSVHPGDAWLRELVPALKAFTGVINLEVFSWEEVLVSINTVKTLGLV
jgi:sugar phosphate isomerase/epimerase